MGYQLWEKEWLPPKKRHPASLGQEQTELDKQDQCAMRSRLQGGAKNTRFSVRCAAQKGGREDDTTGMLS